MSVRKQEGVIKKLPVDDDTGQRKGFGFIKSGDEDFFFHATGLSPQTKRFADLTEGDRVEFEAVDRGRGPRAENVVVL